MNQALEIDGVGFDDFDEDFVEDSALLAVKHSIDLAEDYWTTQDGERLKVSEMETTHVFNAMKMLFNSLAKRYGGEQVEPGKKWAFSMSDETKAKWIVRFDNELYKRTDLLPHYRKALEAMRSQILPKRLEG